MTCCRQIKVCDLTFSFLLHLICLLSIFHSFIFHLFIYFLFIFYFIYSPCSLMLAIKCCMAGRSNGAATKKQNKNNIDGTAAKQAAFEEANKIKNQFRPLDDDEIDFLDGVRARRMEEESALRRETEERLRVFREAQKGSGGGAEAEPGDDGLEVEKEGEKEEWGPVGRKRKREKEKPWGKGIVKRKVSQAQKAEETGSRATGGPGTSARVVTADGVVKGEKQSVSKNSSSEAPTPSKSKLGLVSYGSDDDDEEEDD